MRESIKNDYSQLMTLIEKPRCELVEKFLVLLCMWLVFRVFMLLLKITFYGDAFMCFLHEIY
jgi:hypothetical protein